MLFGAPTLPVPAIETPTASKRTVEELRALGIAINPILPQHVALLIANEEADNLERIKSRPASEPLIPSITPPIREGNRLILAPDFVGGQTITIECFDQSTATKCPTSFIAIQAAHYQSSRCQIHFEGMVAESFASRGYENFEPETPESIFFMLQMNRDLKYNLPVIQIPVDLPLKTVCRQLANGQLSLRDIQIPDGPCALTVENCPKMIARRAKAAERKATGQSLPLRRSEARARFLAEHRAERERASKDWPNDALTDLIARTAKAVSC